MKYPNLFIIAFLFAAAGCKPESSAPGGNDPIVKTFNVRGVVQQIASAKRTVTIKHEAITNYMPAMTMDFVVKNTNELATISPADEITFKLVVREADHWIENIQFESHHAGAVTNNVDKPHNNIIEVKPGDLPPDDGLTAEDGRTIHFSDFRGKVLAFTFIYTRCPLPDYCPRMGRDFQAARDLILAKAAAPTNWQFLSISFDPKYDTPEVLSNYGNYVRGTNADRWLFAVAPMETLIYLAPSLNLMVRYEKDLTVSHNLRTVVLDPQGRVYRQFDSNLWTPQQLVDAMLEAAKNPAQQ
jgi:protein SCO1/2